ncbi:hypothetical protein [Kaistella sp.]|uniref:hypothetical protein n=1 Tax=Kaistella sp. TaxID=2782235 RepID=UPI003C36770B
MNAIRQIVAVKNHKLDIQLPENFDAEFAEVIIFPKEEEEFDFEISEEEKALMRKRFAESKEEDFEDWDTIKHNYL